MKKKIVLLLVILVFVFGISCSRASTEINTESSKSLTVPADSAEITEVIIKGAPMLIDDINKLTALSDVIVVGLEDKYFRGDPALIGFKYGGEITCFGYISNVIGEDCEDPSDNVFSSL